MYRATLIFSYSFSLSGYYTYFGIPSPCLSCALGISYPFGLHTLPAAAPGYFLSFSASIPFFPLRLGYFLHFSASIPFFPLRLGYFLHFSASIPFFPLRPGISCTFRPLYPYNTEILCMLFSYNTQNSIGKRFPQPFL